MTLSIGGFSRVVTFPTAPIATGRSDPCRKGFAPSREPCLSTAHAYIVLSPGTGLFCPRRSRDKPATLTPASGRQDHTPLPSASSALVCSAISVHRIPLYVRDDRETPLDRRRDGVDIAPIRGFGKSEYFFGSGWTGRLTRRFTDLPGGQSAPE